MGKYSKGTYASKNLLRRYAHRTRFEKSIQIILSEDKSNIHLLDVGCGDGFFLFELSKRVKGHLKGFEPFMKDTVFNKEDIFLNWSEIEACVEKNGKFDFVTSFEVFEHLNARLQHETLQHISKFLKDTGTLIISVPIEKGFPSLVKNIFRKLSAPKGDTYYTWNRIERSCLGKPIPECRGDDNYLFHMGFYFDDLEKILKEYFVTVEKFYSPFPIFNHQLNSQVFYVLKNKL